MITWILCFVNNKLWSWCKVLACWQQIAQRGLERVKLGVWMEYWPANDKLKSKGAWPTSRDRFWNFGTPPVFWNGWRWELEIWCVNGLHEVHACERQITDKGGVAELMGVVLNFGTPPSRTDEGRSLTCWCVDGVCHVLVSQRQTTIRGSVARVTWSILKLWDPLPISWTAEACGRQITPKQCLAGVRDDFSNYWQPFTLGLCQHFL